MSWVAVGMAAAGVVAGKMKNDRAKQVEDQERKLAAATQQYSPWTGLQAGKITRAGSAGGDMFGGGVQGAMMGTSMKNAGAGFGSGGDSAPTTTWSGMQKMGGQSQEQAELAEQMKRGRFGGGFTQES